MLYFKLSSVPMREVKFTITTPDPLLLVSFVGNTLD